MRGLHRHAIAATLALGVGMAAQAADYYVGANFGASALYVDSPTVSVTDRGVVGFKLLGGVRFNPYIAIEGGWGDLGKSEITVVSGSGPVVGDARVNGAYIDVVGTYEVRPGWSVLGRAGLFNAKAKVSAPGVPGTSDSDTDFKFGLGVQYELSKTQFVRGEWESARPDLLGVGARGDLLSLGFGWRF